MAKTIELRRNCGIPLSAAIDNPLLILDAVVAVVYYVIRSLPDALSGQYPDYLRWFIIGHTPKILGGLVGGYIAGKRKAKAG